MIIVGIFVFFYILYLGAEILIPLTFAWILAILLNPIVNFLTKRRCNKIVAIGLAILLMIIVSGGIFLFIGSQAAMFSDSVPQLKDKFQEIAQQVLTWISSTFNVPTEKITTWIEEQKNSGMKGATGAIGSTLGTVSGALAVILLMPVYIFLFLFYKPLLLKFISKVFGNDQQNLVDEVLTQTKTLIQNYLVGLLIEMAIVATMNSTALLIIGIKYAVLLGVIGALLNLIPYIGGVIAIALPMIMALVTGDPVSSLYVLGAYLLIQIIDNNYLVPKIVASKVKVNALVSIIVVLIGGALWGVAGMFLSIPITAIAKVIFDRISSLEPFGYLIGDDMPGEEKSKNNPGIKVVPENASPNDTHKKD
jgi:predicted PurR-regulated permease PerM